MMLSISFFHRNLAMQIVQFHENCPGNIIDTKF